MSETIKVGMADLKICKAPDSLTTIGLGSCVGIALYDPITKVSGLAHIMLPDSTQIKNNTVIAKFADTGITKLLDEMIKAGARRPSIVAKIAGGARMFALKSPGTSSINIGDRNVAASKAKLRELRIPLLAEDTGLDYGRTVVLDSNNGDYIIKAVGKDVKTI